MSQSLVKYKKGYLLLNILLICMVVSSIFILILKMSELSKKRYQQDITDLEIKCKIEAKAMTIASSVNVKTKVGKGLLKENFFYYKIDVVEGVTYEIWIYHEERPDLVYHQVYQSNYTGASYEYTIISEGYVNGI